MPTTTVGAPVMLPGFGNTGGTGKYQITTGPNSNGNGLNAGLQINLSPESLLLRQLQHPVRDGQWQW